MGFTKDFLRGVPIGWNAAKSVTDKIPGVNVISKQLPKLHKGGRVPKTGNFRLSAGEVVLNKTQQAALKKAKTSKAKNKIIADVKKRTPKPMKSKK
jgi:hypothetical protein